MRLTNKFNYPNSVVKAAEAGLYKPSWDVLRVSELIDSPLIKLLTIKYWDTLEIDVDECLLTLFGTAWHKFLSGWRIGNEIHDYRWYATLNDRAITGETDTFRITPGGGIIEDNKTTSAWAFVFGRKEWEYQLNAYAYLISQNNYEVSQLLINAFLRDWSPYEALKHNEDYPKHRFHCLEVPLWSKERQIAYLSNRVALHKRAEIAEVLPECSPEEKWQKKECWAVMREGRKSALRVLDTEKAAYDWQGCQKKNSGTYIVKRPGECTKCLSYCLVRNVCPVKGN